MPKKRINILKVRFQLKNARIRRKLNHAESLENIELFNIQITICKNTGLCVSCRSYAPKNTQLQLSPNKNHISHIRHEVTEPVFF